MKVKEEEFVLIKISDSWGFNEIVGPQIMTYFEKENPDYYVFLSPSPILAYFKKEKETDILINGIIEIIRKNKEKLENTAIYKVCSTFIVERNKDGKIIKAPIGGGVLKVSDIVFRQMD